MRSYRSAFTLVELVIYIGIVAIAGSFMGGVLLNVTKVQNRQVSSSAVNQQLQFVMQNIQRLIKESSAIDIDQGIATSTLTIRMKDEPTDPDKGFPTRIYANNGIIYLLIGQNSPAPLTTNEVKVDSLSFLKVANPPGHDSVQIDIALSTNTQNPEQSFSQTLSSAVARVSAATFDANLLPGDTSYDIGNSSNPWNDLHLGRDLYVGRATILGNLSTAPPDVVGSIYYDTTTNTFRGRNNTTWTDFGSTGPWTVANNDIYNNNTGNVGVGTPTPGAKLEVAGQVKITGGTPGAGKVLTSDASGLGSWQSPPSGVPSGYSIIGPSLTPPSGYTYIGSFDTAEIWTAKNSSLDDFDRNNIGGALVNNVIYAIGGYYNSAWYNTNLAYDIVTNSWTTKAQMPTGKQDFGIAVVNNIIYTIGGDVWVSGFSSGPTNKNEAYDPSTNTWTIKNPMTQARSGNRAVAFNDIIYVIGGQPTSAPSNEAYNPATDTWSSKAAMWPHVRSFGTTIANNGSSDVIYIIGGYDTDFQNCGTGYCSAIQYYNPVTDSWTWGAGDGLPNGRAYAAAATVNNKIYIFGGLPNGGGSNADVFIYNPTYGDLSSGVPLRIPKTTPTAVAANGTIYVFGGWWSNMGSGFTGLEAITPSRTLYLHQKN